MSGNEARNNTKVLFLWYTAEARSQRQFSVVTGMFLMFRRDDCKALRESEFRGEAKKRITSCLLRKMARSIVGRKNHCLLTEEVVTGRLTTTWRRTGPAAGDVPHRSSLEPNLHLQRLSIAETNDDDEYVSVEIKILNCDTQALHHRTIKTESFFLSWLQLVHWRVKLWFEDLQHTGTYEMCFTVLAHLIWISSASLNNGLSLLTLSPQDPAYTYMDIFQHSAHVMCYTHSI